MVCPRRVAEFGVEAAARIVVGLNNSMGSSLLRGVAPEPTLLLAGAGSPGLLDRSVPSHTRHSMSLFLAAPTYQFADILGQRWYQKARSLPFFPAPSPLCYGSVKITQAVLGIFLVAVLSPSHTDFTENGGCKGHLQTRFPRAPWNSREKRAEKSGGWGNVCVTLFLFPSSSPARSLHHQAMPTIESGQ